MVYLLVTLISWISASEGTEIETLGPHPSASVAGSPEAAAPIESLSGVNS